MNRTKALFIFLAFSLPSLAQRHYAGIAGVEASAGSNLFHGISPYASIEYSKYKSRVSFWKFGMNYLQKEFEYDKGELPSGNVFSSSIPQGDPSFTRHADNIYFNASYNRTVATNRTSFFLNLGLGALTGVEIYRQDKKQYDFIAGGKLEAELEYFIASRTALVGHLTQLWSPLSDIREWNTTWQVGIKYLIY